MRFAARGLPSMSTWCRRRPRSRSTPVSLRRWAKPRANQLLRRVYSRDAEVHPGPGLDDPGRRLVLTRPKPLRRVQTRGMSIPRESKQARNAETPSRPTASWPEGDWAGLMLGMEQAKKQVKMIRATTKVNAAREKVSLPVSVTSRHTTAWWVRPAAARPRWHVRSPNSSVAWVFCDAPQWRKPIKSRLIGEHLGETENARALLERRTGRRGVHGRMHNLHDPSCSRRSLRHGDHRNPAAVHGEPPRRSGGCSAPGTPRRWSASWPTQEFASSVPRRRSSFYNPDELWQWCADGRPG